MAERTADELQQSARDFVEVFHVAIVGITSQGEKRYEGGGTLVTINSVPGILTADHVWQAVVDGGYTEVAFGGTKSFVAPGITVSLVRVVHRVSPAEPDDGFGPDLAFLWLPDSYVEGMCAAGEKRLFDLTGSRGSVMTARRTSAGDFRLVFGVPAATVNSYDEDDTEGTITRLRVGTRAYFHQIVATHGVKGWGYTDFSLQGLPDDAPEPMYGTSGSGLWRVGDAGAHRVMASKDATFLDGVVVRWAEKAEFIRCHDRISIYRFVDEVVPLLTAYPDSSSCA